MTYTATTEAFKASTHHQTSDDATVFAQWVDAIEIVLLSIEQWRREGGRGTVVLWRKAKGGEKSVPKKYF